MSSFFERKQLPGTTAINLQRLPSPWAPKLSDCASSEEYDALYWAPGEPGSVLGEEWEYVPPSPKYRFKWQNDPKY